MSLGKHALLKSVIRYDIKKKRSAILILLSSLFLLMFFLLLPYIFTNIIERYNQNIIKKKVVVNKSFIYADFNGSDISFIDSLKTFTFAILIPIDKILNVEKFDEILIDVEEVIEKRNCGYLIRGFIEKEEAINAIDKLIINNIVKNDVYDILTPKLVIND